jgi:hypothetical protein
MLNKSLIFLPALTFAAQSQTESSSEEAAGSYGGKCLPEKDSNGLYVDSCGYNAFPDNIQQLTHFPATKAKDEEGRPIVHVVVKYDFGAPGLQSIIDAWVRLAMKFDLLNKNRTESTYQAHQVAAALDCRTQDFCASTGGTPPEGYSDGQLSKICEQAEYCKTNPAVSQSNADGAHIVIVIAGIVGCGQSERIPVLDDFEEISRQADAFYAKYCIEYSEVLEVGGIPAWLIAVIVIVVLFLLTIIIGGTVWYMKRRSAVGQGNREEIEEAKLQDLHDNYEDYGDEDVDEQNVKAATREPALE